MFEEDLPSTYSELRGTCHWIQNNFPSGDASRLSNFQPNEFRRRIEQAISMLEYEFGPGNNTSARLASVRDYRVSPGSSSLQVQWQQALELISDAMLEIQRRKQLEQSPVRSESESAVKSKSGDYVNVGRINELSAMQGQALDTRRLVRLLEEVNVAAANQCWLSVIALLRTILNHIPPAFGRSTFAQVRSQYNGKSFGKTLGTLEDSLCNLANEHLHQTMLPCDPLPAPQQADFRQPLDQLLVHIVRELQAKMR